ncbi:MAG: carbon-nitrogen hydrolase family protein [Oscillospiraceae bacterium]|nr:carbon-nitrogen hydrolase family protein [Oscillospiraceae bacterium]
MTFCVALLQMISCPTQAENLQKGIDWCRRAKAMGADLALFPEMWNVGYDLSGDSGGWNAKAVDTRGEYVGAYKNLARELDMAIAVTYLEKYEPHPRNTVTVIDRFGNIALTYAKVHTCAFDVEGNLTPGGDFYVADLDTQGGAVRIGAMICFDREFPESARILMLKGAEIILVPNACPMEINRHRTCLASPTWQTSGKIRQSAASKMLEINKLFLRFFPCISPDFTQSFAHGEMLNRFLRSFGRGRMRTCSGSRRRTTPMASVTATAIPPLTTAWLTGRYAPARLSPGTRW